MNQLKKWHFTKISRYIKDALANVDSYALILYAPDLLYKSNRPITDMSMFRGPGSRTINTNQVIGNEILLDNELWNVIPVTRYAAGMSQGLYHKEENTSFCGTFYYKEPKSTTLLAYKTSLTFFNKTDAMMHLDPDNQEVAELLEREQHILEHIEGVIPADLKMATIQFYQTYQADKCMTFEEISAMPERPYYIGRMEYGMYALEDMFDQSLCKLARAQGADIVILTHMVGSHQVVTEVLDTRERDDSFKSLLYLTQ